ncbi:MAG: efflux RND transporter permease subunit [Bacteroidota bacterium]
MDPNTSAPSLPISSFRVLVLFGALVLLGALSVPRLSLQLLPNPESRTLRAEFFWPGATPKRMEQEATSLIEGALNRISDIETIESISGQGHGMVQLTFKPQKDLDLARFEIIQVLRQIRDRLPAGVSYPQVLGGGLSDSPTHIKTYAVQSSLHPLGIEDALEPLLIRPLRQLAGIDQVVVSGVPPFVWRVKVDFHQAQRLGLTLGSIAERITTANQSVRLGTFPLDSSSPWAFELLTRTSVAQDWEHIPVESIAGRVVRLGEIAHITLEEQTPREIYRVNGENTVSLTLLARQHANQLVVAQAVEELVTAVQPQLPGFHLQETYNGTERLEEDLLQIQQRAWATTALLLLFLLLVTRQVKQLLIIFVCLLTTLLLVSLLFWLFQITLHLYSLAGIALALGFTIDNSLIMLGHWKRHQNTWVFRSILGATLTTIVAALAIFFLEESQRENLEDFSLSVTVCLGASLLVAYFFTPALVLRLGVAVSHTRRRFTRWSRIKILLVRRYWRALYRLRRLRWLLAPVLLVVLGIPIHLLPDEVDPESSLGPWYNGQLAPWVEDIPPNWQRWLGGVWQKFDQEVFQGRVRDPYAMFTLNVVTYVPEGTRLPTLDSLVQRMEAFISQYPEVETFQTRISSNRQASIEVYFWPETEYTDAPLLVQGAIERQALALGGGSWIISGLGQPFSNHIFKDWKAYNINISGYSIDQLIPFAESFAAEWARVPRVAGVEIRGALSLHEAAQTVNAFTPNRYRLAQSGLSLRTLQNSFGQFQPNFPLPNLYRNQVLRPAQLSLILKDEPWSLWHLKHLPISFQAPNAPITYEDKLRTWGRFEQKALPTEIYKRDQEYSVGISFDFNGPNLMAENLINDQVDLWNAQLPLGFKAQYQEDSGWNAGDAEQYVLIGIVILVVFLLCSLLFESVRWPLAILALIPVACIGAFGAFVLFDWPFDQGGYTAFLFLGGMVVNGGIYITVEYQRLRKQRPAAQSLRKALANKFFPILLTQISTIVGLIPFVWGDRPQAFWSSFAIGTMGGLLAALIGIFFILPLILIPKKVKPLTVEVER